MLVNAKNVELREELLLSGAGQGLNGLHVGERQER